MIMMVIIVVVIPNYTKNTKRSNDNDNNLL